jgi:hypothetical protein
MATAPVTTYAVEACNLSHASENKIHDDQIARMLGFSGGLVPGVEVYAYACHPVVRCWGRDWLAHGRMECRFLKPVYDGHLALVKAAEAQGALEVTVESEGVLCATARAALDASAAVAPSIDSYAHRPPPEHRPAADETSLAAGSLGITPFVLTSDMAAQYRHHPDRERAHRARARTALGCVSPEATELTLFTP